MNKAVTMWAIVYDYEAPKPRNVYHSAEDARRAWFIPEGEFRKDNFRLVRVEMREVA